MPRTVLTLLVIAAIWAGYRTYARFMTPWTRPAAGPVLDVTQLPPVKLPENPADFAVAEQHLQSADWIRKARMKVQFGDSTYIFFDERQIVDERLELRPFAMVKTSPEDAAAAPYVIQCGGAHLTFERPVKIGGESPGRILSAALDGEFTITGPNGLIIHGRDARFAEASHQLYSDQPITFQYTPTEGTLKQVCGQADKLQVDFESATYAVHGRDLPRVGEVAAVTLRRNVDLEFDVEDEGRTTTNRVTSRGPFVFDFPRHLATFQDQVRVIRPTTSKDGQPGQDDLQAEWLALQFHDPDSDFVLGRPKSPEVAESAPDASESESPLGRLELRMVRAIGKAAVPVVVTSSSAHLTGTMHDLLYDAFERELTMQHPSEVVHLTNEEVVLQTPLLKVRHDEAGELTYVGAERNGRLDYQRPGEPGQPPQQFHALWNQQMTLVPRPAEKLIIVTLEGEARVIQPGPENQLGLLCDTLTLDVDSERFDQQSLTGASGIAPTPKPAELPLKHVLAEGHEVAMAGPQFGIVAKRLDVTFQPGSLPKGPTGRVEPASTGAMTPGRLPLQNPHLVSTGLRLPKPQPAVELTRIAARTASPAGFGSVPAEALPGERLVAATETTSPLSLGADDHWTVRAESITALMVQDPATQKLDLREVIGEKNVDIVQTTRPKSSLGSATATPEPPLHVTGNRLHLVNAGGLDQVLHLTGSPAKLDRAGVEIEGDQLDFEREANLASVIGKGMMKSPVKNAVSGAAGDQPSLLTVHWLRTMTFDGVLARFIEGVSTRLDDSVMRCDEMEVTLNRRIDFSAERPDTAGLSIQNVLCQRGVEFQYLQWSPSSEVLVQAQGNADEFELRYDTGDFEARGGGHLEVWQKNEKSRVDVDPHVTARANQPLSASHLPFQYTSLKFHDRVDGNLHKKRATIYDRVAVMYAPVERVLQKFTREELSKSSESAKNAVWLGADEVTVSLHPAPADERDIVQIQAIGKQKRVELEGRLFQANSDTLTYDESTKLFTLRGQEGKLVSVATQERPGGDYHEVVPQQIQFNPAKHTITVQGSRGAFGSR